MTQKKKIRLAREDWILAGFRALSRSGASALKAEALARELGTTKGSFYWHFKDVADFETAMLTYWRARANEEVIATVALSGKSPQEGLQELVRIIAGLRNAADGGLRSESAIRQWSVTNSRVAAAQLEVDTERLNYLTAQFVRAGFSHERAILLGKILYAAVIGFEYLELQQLAATQEGLTGLLDQLLLADKA
ncbi:hypothetical protein BIY26_10405 [Brenneria goodwinii]|uniref:Transcriptional regulator, TetR family n=1 Tax=Brenneria goodwinii TaxID=1109412 RepID=A0A0G4JX49_9GAMM|nr:TetR/AcrR family transcriptional regulator [Brenneria goodwinii]ATA23051.1 hypothetical protein AWC36_02415 [Brenneria goodwinii]RLM24420.1 hypothetical protein BIY26_10405 [Brenneria goodwinii]CPR18028.1 Transcriptional regulator, TetR family [Brenneria goodwinii]